MMDRHKVAVVVGVGLIVMAIAVTAYAMDCFSGDASQYWELELMAVTVDGQEVDEQHHYEDLSIGLRSIFDRDEPILLVRREDDGSTERFRLAPVTAEEGLDEEEEQ